MTMPCAVAQLADALQEARRHRQETGLALHRLDDHRGDRRRIDLRDERLIELTDGEIEVLLLGHPGRRPDKSCGSGSRTISGAKGPKPLLKRPYLLVRLSVSRVRPW